jgi:GAF domain-containing protein
MMAGGHCRDQGFGPALQEKTARLNAQCLSELVSHLCGCLGVPIGLAAVIGPDGQFWTTCMGMSETWTRDCEALDSLWIKAALARRPVDVPDLTMAPHQLHNLAFHALGVRAYLGVPLCTANGLMVGAVFVMDRLERNWSPQDVQMMENLAVSVVARIEACPPADRIC